MVDGKDPTSIMITTFTEKIPISTPILMFEEKKAFYAAEIICISFDLYLLFVSSLLCKYHLTGIIVN